MGWKFFHCISKAGSSTQVWEHMSTITYRLLNVRPKDLLRLFCCCCSFDSKYHAPWKIIVKREIIVGIVQSGRLEPVLRPLSLHHQWQFELNDFCPEV